MPKDRKLTYSDRQSSAAKKAPKKTAKKSTPARVNQPSTPKSFDTTD